MMQSVVLDGAAITAIVIGSLTLGASSVKLVQTLVKKNKLAQSMSPATAGQISVEAWEAKISKIVSENSNKQIMPILNDLKDIGKSQVEIQQKQNEILIELVTVSRFNRAKT